MFLLSGLHISTGEAVVGSDVFVAHHSLLPPGVGECRGGPHSRSYGTGCFPPATLPHSSEEATGLPDSRALLATWERIGCRLSERREGGAEEGEGQLGSRAGGV